MLDFFWFRRGERINGAGRVQSGIATMNMGGVLSENKGIPLMAVGGRAANDRCAPLVVVAERPANKGDNE